LRNFLHIADLNEGKMLQDMTVIVVLIVAAVFAVRRLTRRDCGHCKKSGGKSGNNSCGGCRFKT